MLTFKFPKKKIQNILVFSLFWIGKIFKKLVVRLHHYTNTINLVVKIYFSLPLLLAELVRRAFFCLFLYHTHLCIAIYTDTKDMRLSFRKVINYLYSGDLG